MRREQNHPLPHFHIEYKQEYSASYSIDPYSRLCGELPRKYEAKVRSWILSHQQELLSTWERLQKDGPLELVQEK